MSARRWAGALSTTVVVAVTVSLAAVPGSAVSARTETWSPPPPNARWDYQIGKPYRPRDGVAVVARDREARPLPDAYSICYVNAFQTQPGETQWWKRRHPNLLLREDGRYVVDGFWGEVLLDTSTAAKRTQLARIVGRWIDRCADDGFEAVEPDNLDSWTRSKHQLTRRDAFRYVSLLAGRAHTAGLAIAQKNAAGATALGERAGLDFAVAEECGRWRECQMYMRTYGADVFVVEYRRRDFRYSCERWGDRLSIVLRDLQVTAPGSRTYVYRSC